MRGCVRIAIVVRTTSVEQWSRANDDASTRLDLGRDDDRRTSVFATRARGTTSRTMTHADDDDDATAGVDVVSRELDDEGTSSATNGDDARELDVVDGRRERTSRARWWGAMACAMTTAAPASADSLPDEATNRCSAAACATSARRRRW